MKEKINLNKLQYNKPLISREIISKNLDDYDIYRKYIDYDFKINEVFNSPFRKDNIPSFGIFKNSEGRLIYNDFALGGGDVFCFVKYLFQFKTWWEVYSRIGIDFWLDQLYLCKNDMLKTKDINKINYYSQPKIHEKNIDLSVKIREWNLNDKKYWIKYGLNLKTLKKFNVFPIEYIFFKTNNKRKTIKADKLAYCYIEHKDLNTTFKIYQPYSKYKWINNNDNSVWQGWNNLPYNDNILIITKSLKDVMCLYKVCNIPSISLQNEKIKPKHHIIKDLKRRFNDIYILYDNDYDKKINYGQEFAQKLSDEFNIKNIVIPSRYKSKDFSDLIKNHGEEKAKKILKKLINKKEVQSFTSLEEDNDVPF